MNFSHNPQINWLLSHSYGQGGLVALPFSKGSPPVTVDGEFPAGVQDVLNRLADHYINWPKNESVADIEWCFLVGGPGNGKSEALRKLAELLDVDLPQKLSGQPSPRTIPREWPDEVAFTLDIPNVGIVFINDASIPRSDSISKNELGSLFLDVVDGLKRVTDQKKALIIFGNINRGILVEEDARLEKMPKNKKDGISHLAEQAIKWLLNPPSLPTTESSKEICVETVTPIDLRSPYYGQFKIPLVKLGANHSIRVHVVYLDTLSLLEPLPGGGISKAIKFTDQGPGVSSYKTFGGFSDDRHAARDSTVAGILLSRLIDQSRWEDVGCASHGKALCAASGMCPFFQNIKWLRSSLLRQRFLDLFRAAEVAASRRFTYRDLLGHLSLAILGRPEKSWLAGEHPCEWVVKEYISVTQQRSTASIAELIGHRIYTNLFPSTDIKAWKKNYASPTKNTIYGIAIQQMIATDNTSRNQALERTFNQIDPARDVSPWKDGAREKVLDAIEALEVEKPSSSLIAQGVFHPDANSDIENYLDQAISAEIVKELENSTKAGPSLRGAASRRAVLLRKWRNTLLLRQAGLALGQFYFRDVIALWLSEQYNALLEDAEREIGKGVKSLLLQERSHSDTLFFAPLRPRTYNLDRENLPKNTMLVAVDTGNFKIDIIPRGDVLVAEVLQSRRGAPDRVIASVVVDLPIAREAILRAQGETGSFTEIGSSAFARIERVRASLVGRDSLQQGSMFYTDEVGNLNRIVVNPAGPAPLMVLAENKI